MPEADAGSLRYVLESSMCRRISKHRPRSRATRRKWNFSGLRRGSRVRCAAKFLQRYKNLLDETALQNGA